MHTKEIDGVTVFAPSSAEGVAADEFLSLLKTTIGKSPESIIIDCTEIVQPSSRHVYLLWRSFQDCEAAGLSVYLCNVGLQMIRILVVLDLYDLFMSKELMDLSTKEFLSNTDFVLETIPDNFRMSIAAESDGINYLMDKLKAYLFGLKIPEILRYDLLTLFYEIATNIRLHSQLKSEEKIHFTLIPYATKVRLIFNYGGVEFDPSLAESGISISMAMKNRNTRGYGLLLIKKIADEIIYERKKNGVNHLIIEKRWSDG